MQLLLKELDGIVSIYQNKNLKRSLMRNSTISPKKKDSISTLCIRKKLLREKSPGLGQG
jgi:hypothetical protein